MWKGNITNPTLKLLQMLNNFICIICFGNRRAADCGWSRCRSGPAGWGRAGPPTTPAPASPPDAFVCTSRRGGGRRGWTPFPSQHSRPWGILLEKRVGIVGAPNTRIVAISSRNGSYKNSFRCGASCQEFESRVSLHPSAITECHIYL